MHRYAHYTPMTDTVELAACHRGAPMHDVPTAQLWLMDLRPAPVPVPAPRVSRLGRAARRAYTALIVTGVLTLTGCATVGPNGLADVVTQVLR